MRLKSADRITTPRTASLPVSVDVEDTDIQLMQRVQHDDSEAYDRLVERYWTRVFGRFYRQLNDRQEAEDRAQDVFLRLFRSRHSYRPTAKFSTWLYHIAQNVLRNAVRTRRRKPLRTAGETTMLEEQSARHVFSSQAPAPTESLEQQELAIIVRTAVESLADRQRQAMELQFEDCSYSEIAEELDMTPKAAKSLLYRARHQLRDVLAPLFDPVA